MCLCVRMLILEWKERTFIGKVNSRCFCLLVHQYGVSLQSSTKVRETFRQITQKLWAKKTWDLRLGPIVHIIVFYNISFSWLLPLYYYAVMSDRTTDICWPPFSRYERNFNHLVIPTSSFLFLFELTLAARTGSECSVRLWDPNLQFVLCDSER